MTDRFPRLPTIRLSDDPTFADVRPATPDAPPPSPTTFFDDDEPVDEKPAEFFDEDELFEPEATFLGTANQLATGFSEELAILADLPGELFGNLLDNPFDDDLSDLPKSTIGNPSERVIPIFGKIKFLGPSTPAGEFLKFLTDEDIVDIESIARNMRRDDFQELFAGSSFDAGLPVNQTERVARIAGREVADSLLLTIPVAGAAAKFKRGTQLAGMTNPNSLNFAQQVFRTAAQNPGKFAAIETGTAATAGVGFGIGKEAFPDSPTKQFLSGIAGGLSPTAVMFAPSALAMRTGRDMASQFSPSSLRRATRFFVDDVLHRNLQDQELANIARAAEIKKTITGFDPSLAEQAGSELLLDVQQQFERRQIGRSAADILDRHSRNFDAVRGFGDEAFLGGRVRPSAIKKLQSRLGDDIDFIVDKASGTVYDALEGITSGRAQALVRGQRLAGRAAAEFDPTTAGEQMREAIIAARRDASTRFSARAKELGLDKGGIIDFDQPARDIVDEFSAKTAFDDPEGIPKVIEVLRLRSLKNEPFSFEEFKAFRERVSDDLIDSLAQGTSRKRTRNLVVLKKRVDDEFANARVTVPDLAENYATFRNEYFDGFVKRFEEGAAFRVLGRNNKAFFKTQGEQVANAFWRKGAVSDARKFVDLFGDNPAMIDNLKNNVIDELTSKRGFIQADGTINQRVVDGYISDHRSLLDEIPEVGGMLRKLQTDNGVILDRMAMLDVRTKNLQQRRLVGALEAFAKGSKTPEAVVADILGNSRVAQDFMQFAGQNADVRAALKRVVWLSMRNATAKDAAAYMAKNGRALNIILGKRHVDDLTTINQAMQMIESGAARPGELTTDLLTRIEGQFGVSFQQTLARFYAIRGGFISANYAKADLFARFLRRRGAKHIDSILSEVLYDDTFARELADVALDTRPMTQAKRRRLNSFLFALGIDPTETTDEEDFQE